MCARHADRVRVASRSGHTSSVRPVPDRYTRPRRPASPQAHPAGRADGRMPTSMERLMLLDGNGLIYRGYFALINVPLSTSKGELVNAVFGFSNIVLRGFQDVRPDYVAIAFDLPAPTFRHELSAAYK